MNLNKSSISCLAKSKLLLLASVVGLSGCSSDDDDTGYIKLYNASKNAPAIFLTVDENPNSSDEDYFEVTFSGVEYGFATSDKSVPAGNQFYELAWQDEDNNNRDDLEIIDEDQIYIKSESNPDDCFEW